MPNERSRSENEPVLHLVLARHGETVLNVERRFRGRAEVSLTSRGRDQVALLGKALVAQRPGLLLTSPRGRALETARAIGERTSLEAAVEPRLEDVDYGEWTGLTREEVATKWPAEYERYLRAPERVAFPGGETLLDVETRVAELLSELSEKADPGAVVLVTHDIVVRVLVCRLLDAPLSALHRLRIDVASTTGITLAGDETTVDWINDTSHLKEWSSPR